MIALLHKHSCIRRPRGSQLEKPQPQMKVKDAKALRLWSRKPFLLFLISIFISAAIGGRGFEIREATIDDIQKEFSEYRLSSMDLVDFYLAQIETLNPSLRAVIEVNPAARSQAALADMVRFNCRGRRLSLGPMHGIPVLLKDTIATHDEMNTTAGSYALLGSVVARDAGVVERLRDAGAIILGKTTLTEWYSFRALGKIPNGWCARGGRGKNPYVPEGDPCGSSSGSAIAVAANMVTVSLGSETHGSILCPSDHNSVVGIKPSVGLTSRSGVVPVFLPHDTIGPIARTVSDAVHFLEAIVGPDPRDDATSEASKFIPTGGYRQFLNPDGIRSKRVGVVRHPFLDSLSATVVSTFENHLNILRERGATVVDDLEIDNITIISNSGKSGELTSMMAGFKLFVNDYLKELVASPVRSLADIIAFNEANPELEKTKEYGQHTFIASEKTVGFGKKEKEAIALMKRLSTDGFEKLMLENKLDALVAPANTAIPVLAIGGHPGITVPAGYESNGMPFGICFGGMRGTEPKLIELAYAFEQVTTVRKPPFCRALDMDTQPTFGSV